MRNLNVNNYKINYKTYIIIKIIIFIEKNKVAIYIFSIILFILKDKQNCIAFIFSI